MKIKIKNIPYLTLLLGILVLACSKNDSNENKTESFYELYGDQPYLGQVESRAYFPDGQSSNKNQGQGSFHLIKGKGDSVKLVVYGKLSTSDSVSFILGGVQNGTDWIMSDGEQEANVHGQLLSGILNVGDMKLTLKGNLFDNLLFLELSQEFLATYENIPLGTVIKYNFNLEKVDKTSGNQTPCTNIVWIWKNIWTPSGLQMIQVPQCR